MGTDDPGERDLHQGLIKLAAAFVHATRGNRLGIEKNLRGARELLAGGVEAGAGEGIDVPRIISAIDERLARLERAGAGGADPSIQPARPHASTKRLDSTSPLGPNDPISNFPAPIDPRD